MLLPLYEFLALLPALAGAAWLLWRGNRLTRSLAPALAALSLALFFAVENAPSGVAAVMRPLPLYEFLALLPALAGGGLLLRRADPLTRLLAWWLAATLIALSLAGEKMPWLMVHLALPLALLAARALGAALPAAIGALARVSARPASVIALGGGALLLLLSLRTAAGVAYSHPDTPLEPLIYTQTSPDVPALAREIEAFADAGPGREQLLVTVDTTASFAWPWAWYLRDFPRVRYLNPTAIAEDGGGDGVLIATRSTLDAQPQVGERFPVQRPYRHRWWFPEHRYKSITAGGLLNGIRDRSLLADWAAFYIGGVDESMLGSIDGAVLFPAPVRGP
jgi:predicted membrane-bound mannosyltransferase